MTTSSVTTELSDDDLSVPKPDQYHYDLRLEIGAKEAGTTVPVVAIFRDLVKRMKVDDNNPLVILTATDKLFFDQKDMSSDDFQRAFQVDSIEGKAPKVLLGSKLRSMTKLSDIKKKLMHTYLIPHGLFLREHVGGFTDGVKTYKYGFLKHDHPDHPDITRLNQRFARIISEAWSSLDKDEKNKWKKEHPNVLFGKNGIMLPINFSKERVTATSEGKEKLMTFALIVSTPTKYGPFFKLLLDTAVMAKKIMNLIPFALNRENPDGYYNIMTRQENFIENHRNIPINNIPLEANNKPGIKGQTLMTKIIENTWQGDIISSDKCTDHTRIMLARAWHRRI